MTTQNIHVPYYYFPEKRAFYISQKSGKAPCHNLPCNLNLKEFETLEYAYALLSCYQYERWRFLLLVLHSMILLALVYIYFIQGFTFIAMSTNAAVPDIFFKKQP